MQPGWEVPSQARVIRAPRKNPSLGDILVRAKLEGRVRTPPEKLLCHLAHRYMVSNHVSCSFVRITYGHHDCCTGLYFFFCKPAWRRFIVTETSRFGLQVYLTFVILSYAKIKHCYLLSRSLSHPLEENGLTLLVLNFSSNAAKQSLEALFQSCPHGRQRTTGPCFAGEEAGMRIATGRPIWVDKGRPDTPVTPAATARGPTRQLLEDGDKTMIIALSKHGTEIREGNGRLWITLWPDTGEGTFSRDQPKIIAI